MASKTTKTVDWALNSTTASCCLGNNTTQIAQARTNPQPAAKVCHQLQPALGEKTFLALWFASLSSANLTHIGQSVTKSLDFAVVAEKATRRIQYWELVVLELRKKSKLRTKTPSC